MRELKRPLPRFRDQSAFHSNCARSYSTRPIHATTLLISISHGSETIFHLSSLMNWLLSLFSGGLAKTTRLTPRRRRAGCGSSCPSRNGSPQGHERQPGLGLSCNPLLSPREKDVSTAAGDGLAQLTGEEWRTRRSREETTEQLVDGLSRTLKVWWLTANTLASLLGRDGHLH